MNNKMAEPLLVLRSYLHQDWMLEFDDFRAAIRSLAKNEPNGDIVALNARIHELLGSTLDDAELTTILRNSMDYAFEMDGQTPRQFLEAVLQITQSN